MIKPYAHPRPHREMCWLLDERTVLHESGIELELRDVDAVMQVWASTDLIMALLAEGKGEALTWDSKPIRWGPVPGVDEWPVSVMRMLVPEEPADAIDGLQTWRDWLESYGAAPAGSIGGSGFSLLKATLTEPLYTSVGELPPIKYTLGGRQELGPQGAPERFTGTLQHWDMQAAYARTLGNLRYGGHWVHIPQKNVMRIINAHDAMLYVRAQVRIPEQTWHPSLGPLPERARSEPNPLVSLVMPTEYPTGRTMQGTWTWHELQTAQRWGCKIVKVLDAWLHFAQEDQYPFRPWLAAVEQGRKLGGFAGLLAKATGNSTWGQFAVRKDGQRAVMHVELRRGRRRRIVKPLRMKGSGNPAQRAYELAEYICGRVRAELYRGMMQADTALVCAHTDGLWLQGPFYIQGWRMKDDATAMRLITPQTMAYRRPHTSEDTYVVAGVPVQSAAPFFEDEWSALNA